MIFGSGKKQLLGREFLADIRAAVRCLREDAHLHIAAIKVGEDFRHALCFYRDRDMGKHAVGNRFQNLYRGGRTGGNRKRLFVLITL